MTLLGLPPLSPHPPTPASRLIQPGLLVKRQTFAHRVDRVPGGPIENRTRSPPTILIILTLQIGQTWAFSPDMALTCQTVCVFSYQNGGAIVSHSFNDDGDDVHAHRGDGNAHGSVRENDGNDCGPDWDSLPKPPLTATLQFEDSPTPLPF